MGFEMSSFSLAKLSCPAPTMGVLDRWKDMSGWSCHLGQLLMLGVIFRFIALMSLLLSSGAIASGGQLSLGASSIAKSRILKDCLVIFLMFAAIWSVLLL